MGQLLTESGALALVGGVLSIFGGSKAKKAQQAQAKAQAEAQAKAKAQAEKQRKFELQLQQKRDEAQAKQRDFIKKMVVFGGIGLVGIVVLFKVMR